MIEKAMRDFDIDMSRSFVIGDDSKDIEMARRLGIKSILVDRHTGIGKVLGSAGSEGVKADYTAKDFNDVLEIINMVLG